MLHFRYPRYVGIYLKCSHVGAQNVEEHCKTDGHWLTSDCFGVCIQNSTSCTSAPIQTAS